jgi:hypothetical protein
VKRSVTGVVVVVVPVVVRRRLRNATINHKQPTPAQGCTAAGAHRGGGGGDQKHTTLWMSSA